MLFSLIPFFSGVFRYVPVFCNAPLTEDDVTKRIANSSRKSCCQDSMPTSLTCKCLDILLPVLTRMINISLQFGCWKHAVVQPRLKKPNAEHTSKSLSYISYLTFVSKLAEHLPIVSSTLLKLLHIKNMLMNVNKQHLTLLVLLDLSAAFETADHSILLNHLHSNFGISGHMLSWFNSYMYERTQSVSIYSWSYIQEI